MTGTTRREINLHALAAEMTVRIDGWRLWSITDGATWQASPGDRDDEIVLVRLTQGGPAEYRTIRVRLEER